jgi:hypothetical protein
MGSAGKECSGHSNDLCMLEKETVGEKSENVDLSVSSRYPSQLRKKGKCKKDDIRGEKIKIIVLSATFPSKPNFFK